MGDDRGSRGRLLVAGLCAAGFSVALVALVSAQLALMSILDTSRAERAAEQIAESRFAADIVEQTVVRAVAPIAGDEIARAAAGAASSDPNVQQVVEVSLVNAHRQIVDPNAPIEEIDGNLAVGSAIVTSIIDTAAANGIDPAALGLGEVPGDDLTALDPTAIARQAGLPDVVPSDIPRLGLRQVAETTRAIAIVAMVVFAVVAVTVHPRPGRSLRGIGLKLAIVTGAWLALLVVGGWLIGLASNTLFGEMIDTVWSDAVPAMLLLVGAGVVIGLALVLGGIALDGYHAEHRRREDLHRQQYEQFHGY